MNNAEIAEALRKRARELNDNREVWVQQEPDVPGTMCAVWALTDSGVVRKVVNDDAIIALERWLPGYIAEVYPDQTDGGVYKVRMDVTWFNDSIVSDVDEVIVAFEKCAAELG